MPRITGIYCIRNTVTAKLYVGSSISVIKRWGDHKRDLRLGKHDNSYLQRAWSKHGEDSFEFMLIEECLLGDCTILEQYYIDLYETTDRSKGYNIRLVADSNVGLKRTDETKAKIGAASANRSIETRAKLSAAATGKVATDESKKKVSESLKAAYASGKRRKPTDVSEETRKKMSLAKLGKKQTLEHAANAARARTGKIRRKRW